MDKSPPYHTPAVCHSLFSFLLFGAAVFNVSNGSPSLQTCLPPGLFCIHLTHERLGQAICLFLVIIPFAIGGFCSSPCSFLTFHRCSISSSNALLTSNTRYATRLLAAAVSEIAHHEHPLFPSRGCAFLVPLSSSLMMKDTKSSAA